MPLPTFSSGRRMRASELNAIVAQVNSLTAPGWTAFTPTWTATGSAPSLGGGFLGGRYRRAAGGDLVTVELGLTFGAGTTGGTGIWHFSLPVPPSASAVGNTTGTGWLLNASDLRVPAVCWVDSANTVGVLAPPWPNTATTINNRGGDVTAATPFAWGSADDMAVTITYEAA